MVGVLSQHEDALTSFDKAIALNPDFANAWYARGIALCNLSAHIDAQYIHGNALNHLGRYTEAIESYYKAIAIKPDFADAWYNRGLALGDLGLFTDAVTSLNKALAINPDDSQIWYCQGLALLELGRNKEAVKSFYRALAINPDYSEAKELRDIALHRKKKKT